MEKINENLKLILNLAKTHSTLVKRFDAGMGNGIGFNEFLILLYLNQSPDQTMRRIDLADKINMSASGITRMLLPMEKIGLIKNDSTNNDARVRPVSLSVGGHDKLIDALKRLDYLIEEVFVNKSEVEVEKVSNFLVDMGGKIIMS